MHIIYSMYYRIYRLKLNRVSIVIKNTEIKEMAVNTSIRRPVAARLFKKLQRMTVLKMAVFCRMLLVIVVHRVK